MAAVARDLGSHCAAVVFAGDAPLFALADGTVHCWNAGRSVRAHPALLAAAPIADRALLTAGEDGRICRIDASGDPKELAAMMHKWISCVAADRLGTVAFATGRSVWLQDAKGLRQELQHARNVVDVQFAPDGTRIAVARYSGISLHGLANIASPLELEWKGIYTGLAFSPDGRFVLAFMQDGLLHGWRLQENRVPARHFRMTGYASRIKSWSWSNDGRWFATAGAPSAVMWSFDGEDGPIGTTALEIGTARGEEVVSAVACRPGREEVAVGYSDGAILLASIGDNEERLVREKGGSAVSALVWHSGGSVLAFGSERGECGVIDVPN